jgi:hypothetical protein
LAADLIASELGARGLAGLPFTQVGNARRAAILGERPWPARSGSGRCSICSRADVGEINEALAAGESLRRIASRFSAPRATLARHAAHARAGTAASAEQYA